MARGVCLGVARWGGVRLALGSTHLESFVGEAHDAVVVAERRRQLGEACRALEAHADAVKAGGGSPTRARSARAASQR